MILLKEEYGKGCICVYVEKVFVVTGKEDEVQNICIPDRDGPESREVSTYRFFCNKKVTYIWDPELQLFVDLKMLDNNVPLSFYHLQNGFTKQQQLSR